MSSVLKAYSAILVSLILSGCVSTYYRYEKIPCADLQEDPKDNMKKIALSMGFKEKDIFVYDDSMRYSAKKQIVYKDISKAYIITKKMLQGIRYTVVVVMKSRVKHAFETYDYKLAVNVYSALECAAGIKPKTETTNVSTDKYDRIAKLKALLDSGAITQDEFEAEKKKILESD